MGQVIYIDEWIKNKLEDRPTYLIDTLAGTIEWSIVCDPTTWSVDEDSGWVRGDR